MAAIDDGDLSKSWNGLATTIRGVGQDNFNANLGLAKFMGEEQTRSKELELKEVKLQEDKIKLDKIKAQEKFLQQPATLATVANMITGGAPIDAKALTMIDGIMKMANISVPDVNSTDTNQPLILNKTKNPITLQDVAFLSRPIAAAIVSVNDPMVTLTDSMSKAKQELGLQSAGPTASQAELDQLQTVIASDPSKKALFDSYQQKVNDYARYQKDPRPLYLSNKNILTQSQAILKSLGGDTTPLDTAIAEREKQIDYLNKAHQVTKRQSDVTGIKEGEFLPSKETADIGKDVQASDSAAATNATHINVANINAASHAAGIAAQTNKMTRSAEQVEVMKLLDPERLGAGFDKAHPADAMGGHSYTDPTTKELVQLSPAQYDKLKSDYVAKQQSIINQSLQDNGTAKRLGLDLPGTFKAPLQTRQEFAGLDQNLNKILTNIKDPNFITNINKIRLTASQLLKQNDPKQWEEGRNLLLQATTAVTKQVEAKKANIPKEIKRTVKDNSVGLNAWGIDSPMMP
jgi:hypothetical protein